MKSEKVLRNDILRLCAVMSVSGFEYRAAEQIRGIYANDFDEISSDRVGNITLIKRCGRENAPRVLIDAHFDEIGMLVSEVLDGGFLRIVSIGGIDPSIMQAADVTVYGKSELRGIVASMPPHLRSGDEGKLPAVNELIVDVGEGYTAAELADIAPAGTPVGFTPLYSELGEGYIAGKSFDNKACGAVAARAIADTSREELAADVYLCFSAREETAHKGGGIMPACVNIAPDYAMVIDVNLGAGPDTPERETVDMDKGISIAFSAATDRRLTRMTRALCDEKNIAYSVCVEPMSTGTNAVAVNLVAEGIAVVDVGLPLRNMHTYNEVIGDKDITALYSLVKEFISSGKIAESFKGEEVLL